MVLTNALAGHKIPRAPARNTENKPNGDETSTEEKKGQESNPRPSTPKPNHKSDDKATPSTAAKSDIGKGKGGKAEKGKGRQRSRSKRMDKKGKQGSKIGKGNEGGEGDKDRPCFDSRPRTTEDRKKMSCWFLVRDKCTKVNECPYSHDTAIVKNAKNKVNSNGPGKTMG